MQEKTSATQNGAKIIKFSSLFQQVLDAKLHQHGFDLSNLLKGLRVVCYFSKDIHRRNID